MLLALLAGSALLAAACGKKSDGPSGPPPEVTGLAAVPSNAEVIIGADVGKLADSPIVARAVDQLLLRDPTLAQKWAQVRDGCKLDIARQVKHVMLALGPTPPGGRAGTGPALMVATGTIPEHDLADCIGKLVGKGGGSVTGRDVAGRTVYEVKDGARVMYFSFGRADTVVLGTTEAYVVEAIGAGKKAIDHPELAVWLKQTNQNAPIWGVGRVDERVRKGLVGVLGGLKAGPSAFVGSIDPTEGAKLELGAIMASPEDAKQLESYVNDQKKLLGMVAQAKSLGTVVNKVAITSSGSNVRFRVALDMVDVNQLLSMLDGGQPPAQDSPPSNGSAAAEPPKQ
ncbi:MAG: hypothetical protein H6Q90_4613 [Deltaproteobacteria bacterium]|nr:hypothetical protein [Deltaproteobacteria bacterium]